MPARIAPTDGRQADDGPRRRSSRCARAAHSPRPVARQAVGRRHNEGHGRRLTAAFEALEAFPALAESRNRLLRAGLPRSAPRPARSSPRSSPTSRW